MTSSSWVTGSLGAKEDDRRIHNSMFTYTSGSHASIKRLSFTSPTINVGPTDARDEIMNEIVNKPLVFKRNDTKSQSAPPGGRVTSRFHKSAGKSSRWTSSKRARTSMHRGRHTTKSWEKNPGPFMTVKVSGKDLWIVSNSTPTSYFNDAEDDGLRETSGMSGTKLPKWEDTAESVPKQEQTSPPRHERLLGAPAQFAPTIQWLRYDPSAPAKKPPLLTPFKESLDDGRYYNVESTLTSRVSQHLNASPGVRIARNGEVLSHSLKLESSDESDHGSASSSDGEESDVEVASLIPAKLAAEMRKHYSAKRGSETPDEEDSKKSDGSEMKLIEQLLQPKDQEKPASSIKEDEQEEHGEQEQESEAESSLSSTSDNESPSEPKLAKNPNQPTLTKDSLALLTKLSGHNLANPLLGGYATSATSNEESVDSHELNEFIQQIPEKDLKNISNGQLNEQQDVWAVLEHATPGLWTTKSKLEKMVLLKRLRRQRKSEQPILDADSTNKSMKQEQVDEVILPLCWEDELAKSNTRVVHVKSGRASPPSQNENTSLPVVFHKALRYDRLPAATVGASVKVPSSKNRPRSATAQNAKGANFNVRPSKGYRAPVSTPRSNRSMMSRSASTTSSTPSSSGRGHSAPQSLTNGLEIIRQSLDLADLLRVTPDSFPAKTAHVTTHTVKKERVTIVHDDVSEQEMEVVRRVAAQSMKGQNHGEENSKKPVPPTNDLNAKAKLNEGFADRLSAPVGTINLSSIEADNTTNESNTISSQRRFDEKFAAFVTPQNTPKSHLAPRSAILTPKNSARGAHPTPIRFPVNLEDLQTAVGEDVAGKNEMADDTDSPAPDGNNIHISSSQVKATPASRQRGFASTPLTQSRLKSGSSRAASGHFGPGNMSPPSGSKAQKSLPLNGVSDGMAGIPAIQIGTPLAPPLKTADFIQITQSLHISERSGALSETQPMTGNKMYDSYMRELAAHGSSTFPQRIQTAPNVVGRSLGGTSGKASGFAFPHSMKKNLSGYHGSGVKHNQQQSVPNISPFTPQAGRRSGLTMVPQDKPGHRGSHLSQKVGPFGLGVKGDQVRLNIDKNIHNIYRDLGLIKEAREGRGDIAATSPGRSHLSSAKSKSPRKEESVISIPTASDPSVANGRSGAGTEAAAKGEECVTTDEGHKRPSSSNPSITVQDSETQWSGRTMKTDNEPNTTPVEATPPKDTADSVAGDKSSAVVDTPTSGYSESATKEESSPTLEVGENEDGDGSHDLSPAGSPENGEESVLKTSRTPTSDRSMTRAVSRSSDAESSVTGPTQPAAIHRSASETLLDRLAELGDQASDVTDDEVEENDDVDVKGVTRVTVNMPDPKDTERE